GGDEEREDHARDRRVHAGVQEQHPGDQRDRQQQRPRRPVVLLEPGLALVRQPPERRQRHQGDAEIAQLQVGGVEDRDDGDRDEVVDDREGEQEGAQRGGQRGAQQREDRD